jgi:hypothetical protein
MTRFLKSHSPNLAFNFFTYLELILWFVFCIAINPFRWKRALFVFSGIGDSLPRRVVEGEGRLGQRMGVRNGGYDYGSSF